MKKIIIPFAFSICITFLYAQDYQCVKENITYMFAYENGYYAIAIDSVLNHPGYDSYYNFPVIGGEDNFGWCLSGNWPSWIGRKIDVYPNGDHLFFNCNSKAILIKTQSQTGDSWISFVFADGRYVESGVENIVLLDFLGLTDSVKIITFQVKDENGNNLAHDLNDKQLKISKNFGMVRALNFKLFPDLYDWNAYSSVQEFSLAGLSDPEVGVQNLTFDEIYSFDEGDEFHVHDYMHYMEGYSLDWYEILHLSSKESNNNSLMLTYDRCARREIHNFSSGFDTVYFYQDTIIENVNPEGYICGGLNYPPEKFFIDGDTNYYEYSWFNQGVSTAFDRMGKVRIDGYYSAYPHDCIEEVITKSKYYEYDYFLDGLGGPYWDYGDFGNHYYRGLVYYNIAGEEWGTPYNCDSLLTGYQKNGFQSAAITFAPNPMKEWTKITFPNQHHRVCRISIFNSLGKIVFEKVSLEDQVIIERKNLDKGLYIVQINDGETLLKSEKLIIK